MFRDFAGNFAEKSLQLAKKARSLNLFDNTITEASRITSQFFGRKENTPTPAQSSNISMVIQETQGLQPQIADALAEIGGLEKINEFADFKAQILEAHRSRQEVLIEQIEEINNMSAESVKQAIIKAKLLDLDWTNGEVQRIIENHDIKIYTGWI